MSGHTYIHTHTYTQDNYIHTHKTTTRQLQQQLQDNYNNYNKPRSYGAPRVNKDKDFRQGKLIHSSYNFEEPRKISKHNIIKIFQYSVHSGTHKHAVIHQQIKTKSDFVPQRTAVLRKLS